MSTKSSVIPLSIKDKDTLYRSYMPFLTEGGLFIPTNRPYELGDDVFVILTLMEERQKFPITGRVVWLVPRPAAGRPAGIGIHFMTPNPEAQNQNQLAQKKIETYLGGALKVDRPTYTM